MKTVYIETSILSYLTSRPSRDLLAAAHQQVTQAWWERRRQRFEVFVSPLVAQEAKRGDPDAAQRRVVALTGLPLLEIVEEAYELAAAFIAGSALPAAAEDDATHCSGRRSRDGLFADVELPPY